MSLFFLAGPKTAIADELHWETMDVHAQENGIKVSGFFKNNTDETVDRIISFRAEVKTKRGGRLAPNRLGDL